MALRLRLKFQRGILSESQNSDGLKRSWVLVNPQHETLSDVVLHILRAFDLFHTCPNGILLSMDGFVLPPFVSTRILKDKDLICVKRKGAKVVKFIEEHGEETAHLEHHVVEKQPLNPCLQLLRNEELNEPEWYECENEEEEHKKDNGVLNEENVPNGDVPVKKRKASKEIKSSNSKKKRKRQELHDNDEKEAQKEHSGVVFQNGNLSRKKQCQELHDTDEHEAQKEHHGASLLNGGLNKKISKMKQAHIPGVREENLDHVKHKTNAGCSSLDEGGEGTVTPSGLSNRAGQSRSARRKKAKRRWLRAEKEQLFKKQSFEEDQNADLGSNKKDQNLATDNHHLHPDELKDQILDTGNHHLTPSEDSDTENEIVPVVVAPGHIRFAAPGKEKDITHNHKAEETFTWSGTINKKKGQQWGRENQSSWNGSRAPYENQSSFKINEYGSPKEKQSHSVQHDSTTPSGNCTTKEVSPENAAIGNDASSVDYEKLVPMTDSPVEGDIIAYRLLELSSSFCPELTAYRVGKVSWFDPESKKLMLVPVPQYPLELPRSPPNDDTSEELLPETSCYNEDGSLEIEFLSLVDVRMVKHGKVSTAPAVHHKVNGVPTSELDSSSSGSETLNDASEVKDPSTEAQSICNNKTSRNKSSSTPRPESGCTQGPENGRKDTWEEITAALSAKKAELLKEDNWNKKRPSRSYRVMRSSALGPTLALLRAQNNHQTE